MQYPHVTYNVNLGKKRRFDGPCLIADDADMMPNIIPTGFHWLRFFHGADIRTPDKFEIGYLDEHETVCLCRFGREELKLHNWRGRREGTDMQMTFRRFPTARIPLIAHGIRAYLCV